jgi:hypothetical protein
MEKPYYILAANPIEPNRIIKMFESGEGSIMGMLQNPDRIRDGGWDLRTYDTPRIVKGEYLEVKNQNKTINLYEDGTLILRALADSSFLCWGIDDAKLNPLPLIEVTFNFVDFYIKLLPNLKEIPKKIEFTIEFINTIIIENSKLYLYKDYFEQKKYAPEKHMQKKIEISPADPSFKVGHITFLITSQIYNWFCIENNEIPYKLQDEKNNYFIDKEKIIKLTK